MPFGAWAVCGRHDTESERCASSQKVAGHSHTFPPRAEHNRSRDGRRGPWGKHWQDHVSRYPINMLRAYFNSWFMYLPYHDAIPCMFSQLMNLRKFCVFKLKYFPSDTATEWAFVVHAHGDGAVCNRTPPPCLAKPSSFPLHVYSPAGTLLCVLDKN